MVFASMAKRILSSGLKKCFFYILVVTISTRSLFTALIRINFVRNIVSFLTFFVLRIV